MGGETADGVGIEAGERVSLDLAQLEPLGGERLQGPPHEAAQELRVGRQAADQDLDVAVHGQPGMQPPFRGRTG